MSESKCRIKRICFDMDGVLTDFKTGVFSNFPEAWGIKEDTPNEFWELINKQMGKEFWVSLNRINEGMELLDYARKQAKISILSAYPKYNGEDENIIKNAVLGKKEWIINNITHHEEIDINIVKRSEKINFCDPHTVLVDDYKKNVNEWEKVGGTAIYFKKDKNVMQELREIMRVH